MNIQQLIYILEVEKHGSISKASAQLFISQPMLSASIKALEEELGVKLFIRKSHGVSLSPHGEAMLPVIKNMVNEYQALQLLGNNTLDPKINIHIAYNPTFEDFLIKEILKKYHAAYPHIHMFLKQYFSSAVVNQVQKKNVSIGCCAMPMGGISTIVPFIKANAMTIKTLKEEDEFVVWCRKDHPAFSDSESIAFLELKPFPFAVSKDSTLPNSLAGKGKYYSSFDNIIYLSSNESVKKAILFNNMCAILPRSLGDHDITVHNGTIRLIPLKEFDSTLIRFICYRQDTIFSPVEENILTDIIEHYQGIEDKF